MRRIMVIVLALVASLGITASTASTATTETGVTATSIKIGGTFPLSGPASLYATIPAAMKAYFSYVNARRGPDGKRGVYGRQIVFNYKDDQSSPPQAVQLTRELVAQDGVFAIVGSLGTEVNLATRPYLNSKKVPQMLVATGATTWGNDWKLYPWTTGWQPGCAHPHTDLETVPATVLDPFGGSGTVARVATKLGRNSLLIELNPEYRAIAGRLRAQASRRSLRAEPARWPGSPAVGRDPGPRPCR